MKKKVLRQENLIVLNFLLKKEAISIISATTFSKLTEDLKKEEIEVSKTFLRDIIKTFLELDIIKEGLLAAKNAKTYYIDKEKAEKFIVNIQTKKEKRGGNSNEK